jgi:energy-coupling factor transporter ATP-binding protein EcfA2
VPATTSIRILANENNRRGDLFGRLIADLFVALGYEQPRLNVHKSGRELDLVADHRLEPRRAIGECKATSSPIGGDDLNKLLGVRERERGEGAPVVAYFVSLAGFTETAIEQERKTVNPILLLTAADVVRELVGGRILIPRERATEIAGQCRATNAQLTLDLDAELLAHERGWIWAVYYNEGKARTHVALIHSDGTRLARAVADEVIAADRECGGALHTLICLNPEPAREAGDAAALEAARAAWCEYLATECGYIHLDGLPADAEVGSKRLALENLFVPLHLDVPAADKSTERQPLGVALGRDRRLALLGAPGAGKSTLLKRLAVAYADSTRRAQVDDGLPARKWLPVFIRCRELRGLARGSFAELMQSLSQREGVRQHADAFLKLVDDELLEGRVLLLVDGLDEISDPGDRAAFVATLRTTLLAYPKVAIVVTSREAGFRHVASHLSSICLQTSLSPFDDDDVKRLTVAWHREVVGESEKVRADAESLAASIRANDRIKQLAVNPLLLTTLLLVKRWVGSLPTKRAVLYGKAVEVLLMTWNVEGHKPIPTEEALPQLCYVASTMMLEGIQKISRPRLAAAIKAARKELETELGYAAGTVGEFIQRVEERSSLLMMTGHDVEDGELVEFFEFRHLTFQEYLTAKAMVEGWHPGRDERDTLATVLCEHFDEQRWREVIPLAAAIGGKATDALMAALTTHVDKAVERSVAPGDYRGGIERKSFSFLRPPAPIALLSCLTDDVAARPSTIRAALQALVERGEISLNVPRSLELSRSRYAAELADVAGAAFLSRDLDFTGPGEALAVVLVTQKNYKGYADLTLDMLAMLKSSDRTMRCGAAIVLGKYSWHLPVADVPLAAALDDAISAIASMIESRSSPEVYAAIEAAGALGRRDHATMASLTAALFRIWIQQQPLSDAAGRALIRPAIHKREPGWAEAFPADVVQSLLHDFDGLPDEAQAVALVAAWYSRIEADDALKDRCRRVPEASAAGRVAQDLLDWLEGKNAAPRVISPSQGPTD